MPLTSVRVVMTIYFKLFFARMPNVDAWLAALNESFERSRK